MTVLRAASLATVLLGAVSETARADVQATGTTEEVAFQSAAPGAVIAADPVAPPSDPFVAPPAENDESAGGSAQFVEGDARSGQAYVTPTAFTTPQGKATFQAWVPAIPVGGVAIASYGMTSRVEIGAGALFAFDGADGGAAGIVTAKLQILRSRRAALAVQGYYMKIPDEEDSLTTLSAVGSSCLGARCQTVVSLSLTAIPTQATDDNGNYGDALVVGLGGSIVAGTGRKLKLVAEGMTFAESGDRFTLLYAGLRAAGSKLAADFGLVAASDDDDIEVLPMPMAAVSARF